MPVFGWKSRINLAVNAKTIGLVVHEGDRTDNTSRRKASVREEMSDETNGE